MTPPADIDALRTAAASDVWLAHLLSRLEVCSAVSGRPFGRPGRTHAVTVRDGEGVVWWIEVDASTPSPVPMGRDAARACQLASRLVQGELGGLRPELLGRAPEVGAWPVAPPEVPLLPVEGDSLGLAVALAQASALLAVEMPPDVLAAAALAPDGAIEPVDALPQKLAGVARWAPAIRRVLVARAQQALPVPAGLVLVPVDSLDDALDLCFVADDLRGVPRDQRLADRVLASTAAEQRPALARTLFHVTVRGSRHVLRWSTVAALAEALGEGLAEPHARWRMQVARAVAGRHAGWPEEERLCLEPEVEALPLDLRLDLEAHQVQHLADAATVPWRAEAQRAEELVARHAGLPGSARLQGALGRLYASWGSWTEARAHLRGAWEQWRALLLEQEGAIVTSEWLRVAGAQRDAALVDEITRGALAEILAHPASSDLSRAFLAVAAGRAWLAVGDRDAAARWLEPERGGPDHLLALRLRLLLELRWTEDRLARLRALDEGREYEALARLATGRDADRGVLPARELRRLEAVLGAEAADGPTLARCWRY